MNRGELLTQAWSMIWRHPALWVIAFAGFAAELLIALLLSSAIVPNLIMLAVAYVIFAFTTGAIIGMVNGLADGKPISVLDGWNLGRQRVVGLFNLSMLLRTPLWLLLLISTGAITSIFSDLGMPLGMQATNAAAYARGLSSALGLILVVSVFLQAISVGAERAIALEGRSVLAALRHGWKLLRTYWSDYVVIGLMLVFINIIISVTFSCTIGAAAQSQLQSQTNALTSLRTAPAISALVLNIVVSLLFGAFVFMLASSVWTLAFREWQVD